MQKRIEVSLSAQKLRAFEDSKMVHEFECVTGDSGHPTDKGLFHVFAKDKDHVSHIYHVKMYYALFFTQDGKAIHQYHGPIPLSTLRALRNYGASWIGSHGCVRLSEENARTMFDWAPMHTLVEVS